jgi:hypothetical protein
MYYTEISLCVAYAVVEWLGNLITPYSIASITIQITNEDNLRTFGRQPVRNFGASCTKAG